MKSILVCLATLSLLISGCSHAPVTSEESPGANHVILLWLKEPDNLKHQQQIIQATESLQLIPGVIKIRTGISIPSSRKIVDDSFDIGIHMFFANQQVMEEYINHPQHTNIVRQEIMPFVEKIVIYDFEGY